MNESILALVDKAIRHCSGRDTVPSTEITDMLLDIRILLATDHIESEISA